MNVPSPARKPSGALTYRQSQGANVWPGFASSDRNLVRVREGKLVIFQALLGDDMVAVSAGNRDCVLSGAEWRSLPVYED